jgi:protein-S-isoprenylcysteine O-methyltransferase Ste14
MNILSVLGLLAMGGGMLAAFYTGNLVSSSPIVIALQIVAVVEFAWARVTFGVRSFHATANPTAGGVVRTGPYAYVRHPIYASLCLFVWAGAIAQASVAGISAASLVLAGALARIWCEEQLLVERYPEYRAYAETTRRLVPFIL